MPGGGWTALALAVALAWIAWLGIRQALAEENPRNRHTFIGLRVLTAVLAWIVASQPQWVVEEVADSEGRLAILVDASRSMSLPRNGDESPRHERASEVLARWRDEGLPAGAFTFGEGLEGAQLGDLAESVPANEDDSRLGPALLTLFGQDLIGQDEEELGAVLVLSDGADRSGVTAQRLARSGVRVHTVAISEPDLRDDSVAELQADPVGFLRRPARVRVVVRSLGGPGGPIPVTLRRGDEVVREVIAEVPANGEAAVEVPFTPTRLGREVYRVTIPRASGDAVPENDERAFLVRVTRDKLRVLLVAGQPSWDERFLRSFLKRDPATDLISFFILRSTSDMTMAGPDELALIPFPTDELFNEHLGSFDLVIFQNFEYGPYQMQSYLPRIREYVRRGGSFAMIGGPLSFHSGGYSATPIADVLPVDLHPPGTSSDDTIVTDRFAPRISRGMEHHPLLALVPNRSSNAQAWARLSNLIGANVVLRVRDDASTLLEHPTHRIDGDTPLPILVLGTAGEGRTLALTTDTTWRWGITTGGETGDASAYERFWDRAVRWLSRDPALEPARVTTDRPRYGPGATARVTLHLRDARYAPHAEESVRVTLNEAAGGRMLRESQTRTDREGRAEMTIELPDRPGAYRVEATLSGRDAPLAEEWLVLERGGDELADPRANPERLAEIADATGGTFYADPDDAPNLADIDTTRTRSLGVVEYAPFASWWAFGLLCAAFTFEWIIRRRWGRR